ncbi:MAG: type II secretion system protein [Wenzhouxiangellaceae bacterium]
MPRWAEDIGDRRPRQADLRPVVGAVSDRHAPPVGAVSDRDQILDQTQTHRRQIRPPQEFAEGFTLLELVIVITLVILLFLTAWNRLMPLRGDAEAAHVVSVIGTLRSALGMVASEQVMEGGLEALTELADTNPMALLQQTPDNYIGTRPGDIPPGSWYFDDDSATLRYRVRFPQYLAAAPQDPVELAWRIHVTGDDQPNGVHLAALDNPHWPGHSRALRELAAGTDPGPDE